MLTTQVKWHQKLTGSGCKTQWLCGNLHCGLSSVKVLVAQKALDFWYENQDPKDKSNHTEKRCGLWTYLILS